jgi:hypothetical protein
MITRNVLPTHLRISVTSELFGLNFPMKLEPLIFNLTDHIADNYCGGYWDFYTLSNGGFYMSPCSDEHFNVSCENGFEEQLSADALGIMVCLYAYSHLSFNGRNGFDEICAEHYHLLREFAFDHDESRGIFSAID